MASIDRTAYPRFKRFVSARELAEVYSLSGHDELFVTSQARGSSSVLVLAVLLKSFQRLGYFPALDDVPDVIVDHLRQRLRLAPTTPLLVGRRTLYRHFPSVRAFLGVEAWGTAARHAALVAVHSAASVKDNPADLVNVAIEELVRARFELPAFRTLDELVGRVRAVVNRRVFEQVNARLDDNDRERLDALLIVAEGARMSGLQLVKSLPKRPTVRHLSLLVDQLARLDGLLAPGPMLVDVPAVRVAHLAAQAWALDAAELRDVTVPKRHVLLVCLLQRCGVQVRDDLAEMFCRLTARMNQRAKDDLDRLREQHRVKNEELIGVLGEVVATVDEDRSDVDIGREVRRVVDTFGGREQLRDDIDIVSAFHGDNHLPLLRRHYRSQRSVLFRLINSLEFVPTSADRSLFDAIVALRANERRRSDLLDVEDLSFATDTWRDLVMVRHDDGIVMDRRYFEVCVFMSLSSELRSGDIAVVGSDAYADWRTQLLAWDDCKGDVESYCADVGIPADTDTFIAWLQDWLGATAHAVDTGYSDNGHVVITADGEPILKRPVAREPSASAATLEAAVGERVPQRNVLDILAATDYWCGWTRHFGPLSGSDPKIDDPATRYLLTVFTYGCNLGPAQASRHMPGVSAHMLGFVNRRHVSLAALEAANRDLINVYHRCALPHVWGNPAIAAADGTKYDLTRDTLIAEYHIRYGGYGGIAYRHVSDTYIALFTRFIPCGVWEGVHILDGLLANNSDMQPDTVHADTQGQSTPVLALSHLLGIKLMPRIRNWKHLRLYRPSRTASYQHIDSLFTHTIDWERIRTHHQDLLRVVLSIRAGTLTAPTLLRRLSSYSHRNRLYQAFQELGRVVRTVYLLRSLSDIDLREQVTRSTNKVEAYHGFAKWFFFGGEGTSIGDNDPDEMDKRVKYNDLVANSVALHNVVAITAILEDLARQGTVHLQDVRGLSPYLTTNVKRFGDYHLPDGDDYDPVDPAYQLRLAHDP